MSIVTLIIEFLKVGALVLKEIFEAKKRAREKNEAYEISRDEFRELIAKCAVKHKEAIKESTNIIDDALSKPFKPKRQ